MHLLQSLIKLQEAKVRTFQKSLDKKVLTTELNY